MKTPVSSARVLFPFLFIFSIFQSADAQYPGIDDSIAKYRKGELNVIAKRGDEVIIEQLEHEFWFGCAISNGVFGNRMAENDKRQYKEKFLQNFNSAVTENALKWLDMERQKGQPDFTIIDGILNWTEENNIPLRGHNLFWGIPQFVQPWKSFPLSLSLFPLQFQHAIQATGYCFQAF